MKNEKTMTTISKIMSLVLRHKPELISLNIDKYGWVDVNELIKGLNNMPTKKIDVDRFIIEEIVNEDSKQRYSFNEDKTKIRANQGHSIDVDVELEKVNPPDTLYHGTIKDNLHSIMEKGLTPKNRLYVHLTSNINLAWDSASRWKNNNNPIVLHIDTNRMKDIQFYKSKNNVYLVKHVPSNAIVGYIGSVLKVVRTKEK